MLRSDSATPLLVIVPDMSRGGVNRIVASLAKFCLKNTVPIQVLYLRPDLSGLGELGEAQGCASPFSVARAVRFLRRHRSAIVYSAQTPANAVAAMFAPFRPFFPSLHVSLTQPAHPLKDRLRRGLYVALSHLARRLVTVSDDLRRELIAIGAPARKVQHVRNPLFVDGEDIGRVRAEAALWRSRLGCYLAACGRLERQKGFDLLVEATALARQEVPDIRICIIGEGSAQEALLRSIAALGIGANVTLLGYCPDARPVIAAAAGFVLSSRYEGFGNVAAEAVALNVPTVAFDCPVGPREILAQGRRGLLVPDGDVQELARALVLLWRGAVPRPSDAEALCSQHSACHFLASLTGLAAVP